MLEQILDHIHNYFVKSIIRGEFTIKGGRLIGVKSLQDGQYFKIQGSVFNDGVYVYPSYELTDETFDGEIWAMAVPPSLIALSKEIHEWQAKYGDVVNGPFQSESFGGYSYSKASSSSGNGTLEWSSVFKSRLDKWRKIGVDSAGPIDGLTDYNAYRYK